MGDNATNMLQQQQELVNILQQQAGNVQQANQQFANVIPQVGQELLQLKEEEARATDILAAKAQLVTDEMQQTVTQLERVKGNPLLDFVGFFDPNFSTEALKTRLQKSKLTLENLRQQYQFTKSKLAAQSEQAKLKLELANQQRQLAGQNLAATSQVFSALSTAVNAQIQTRQLQRSEMKDALAGATIDELTKAIENKQPDLIHPAAKLGDLRTALRQKQLQEAQLQKAHFAQRIAELDFSEKQKALADKALKDYLTTLPDVQFNKLYQAALQKEQQGDTLSINGVAFPLSKLNEVRTEKLKAKKEQRTLQTELTSMDIEAAVNADVSATRIDAALPSLMRFANETNGGALPPVIDEGVKNTTAWVPDQYKADYAEVQKLRSLADQISDPLTRNEVLQQAETKLQEIDKAIEKDLKSQVPKPAQPGVFEYIKNGQIGNATNAAGVLSTNTTAIAVDPITRPGWSDAMDTVLNQFTATQQTLETKSADAILAMFPDLQAAAGGSSGGIKPQKGTLVMQRALQELGSNRDQLAQTQSTMLNEWWAQYLLMTLKDAQDRQVPGFENLVNEDLTPGRDLVDPVTGKFGPQTVLKTLAERSNELKAKGALPLGKSLVDMFLAEFTNSERLQQYYSNVVAPRTATEAALAYAIFGNRQRAAFYKRVGDIYNALPVVQQVVQENQQIQEQTANSQTQFLQKDQLFSALTGN